MILKEVLMGLQINRHLLDAQHIGCGCVLSAQSLQQIVKPTVTNDGQRASTLPPGQLRVMTILNAPHLICIYSP